MNIFKRLFGVNEKGAVPFSWFAGTGMQGVITRGDVMDFYKSWVYACVTKRSLAVAKTELKLYRLTNGKIEEVEEHELLELLYRVNPQTTKFNFWQLSCIYRDMFGASPWILDKTNETDKYPSNIFLARPDCFKVKRSDDGTILGYQYKIGAFEKNYDSNSVIFLKNYNPSNPDKGIGLIEAVRMTAENDDYIIQSNNSLLKNNARPSGHLETDKSLSEGAIKRLKKQVRSKLQGFANTGEVTVFEEGLKFKADMLSPADLDYIQGRKMNREEICAIFGVPVSILGISEDVNLANAKVAEQTFLEFTIDPLVQEIVEQLNEFLVPKFGNDLWLDYEPIVKEDRDLKIKEQSESINRWRTTNEVRAMDNLPPIQGGDYIYMNFSSMPAIGGEKKDAQVIKIKAEREDIDLKTQKKIRRRILNRNLRIRNIVKRIDEKVNKNNIKKTEEKVENKKIVFKIVKKDDLDAERKKKFYEQRMKNEARLEGIWKKKFVDFFANQEKRFLEAYENSEKKSASLVQVEEEVNKTVQIIQVLMYETVVTGIAGASELIGREMVVDMDFIKSWIDKVSAKIGKQITTTTVSDFESSIKEGIEAGESMSKIQKRIQDVFEFARGSRAEMIARTETARGVTEAHRATYEHYGFDDVEWLLAPDSCEICEEKSKKEWTVKSIKGALPVHPNCKCDFTPIIKD